MGLQQPSLVTSPPNSSPCATNPPKIDNFFHYRPLIPMQCWKELQHLDEYECHQGPAHARLGSVILNHSQRIWSAQLMSSRFSISSPPKSRVTGFYPMQPSKLHHSIAPSLSIQSLSLSYQQWRLKPFRHLYPYQDVNRNSWKDEDLGNSPGHIHHMSFFYHVYIEHVKRKSFNITLWLDKVH